MIQRPDVDVPHEQPRRVGLLRRALSHLRRPLKDGLKRAGIEVVRYRPDYVRVPRYLCPNARKLFDFRQEPGFAEVAAAALADGRTTLGHDRLFMLWQAVRNTHRLGGAVAEVGSYRGGSARFLADAHKHFGRTPPVHVFDTFSGHPGVIVAGVDGAHQPGTFSDTSYESVKAYLLSCPNIVMHVGSFSDTRAEVQDESFALAHVDVDIYQSTVDCLDFFWPRLRTDGVIVLDDYGFRSCQGLKRAVDDFVALMGCPSWYVPTGQMILQKRSNA